MTFLPQYSQVMFLKLQANEVQHKIEVVQNRMKYTQDNMQYIDDYYYNQHLQDGQDYDVSEDPYYRELEKQSQNFETVKEEYDNQLNVINTMIEAQKNQITKGITDSCGMFFSGGK